MYTPVLQILGCDDTHYVWYSLMWSFTNCSTDVGARPKIC